MEKLKKYKLNKLNLKFDKFAKTASFYNTKKTIKIDLILINFLKEFSNDSNNCDVRICMHNQANDKNHDMILLQNKKNYYRPHKHINKGDTFHIIEGKLAYFIFNNKGFVEESGILKKNELFRTYINQYHAIMPISNIVIYHENKKGPFLKNNDSIFLKNSPSKFDSLTDINKYKKKLMDTLYDKK